MNWCGLSTRRTGKWLHVKGDDSLKADVLRNTYTDFSTKYGAGTTIDFVINWQGCDFKTAVEQLACNFCGYLPEQTTPPPPPPAQRGAQEQKKYIAPEIAQKYFARYDSNRLAQYCASLFDKPISEISPIFKRYAVGTGKAGETVFFYCDIAGRYEQPKVFEYDQTTGKRQKIHTPKPYTSEQGYCRSALFGAQLLNSETDKIILLVESEKTALLAALCFPELLALATGGKENLKPEYCTVLRGRDVIVLPDADAREAWLQQAIIMRSNGINARYLDLCPCRDDKSDLADYIAEAITAGDPNPEWVQRLQTMINSFFIEYDIPVESEPLPKQAPAEQLHGYELAGLHPTIYTLPSEQIEAPF
jgi:hypothetical protein